MAIQYINDANFEKKKVLARFDFNTPLTKENPRTISDSSRVDLALPTIRYILENGCEQLILMSHLGRPKGEVKKEYSLEPVAQYLAEKLNTEVVLAEAAVDAGVKPYLELKKAKIVLLENLRFHKGEESNDLVFAQKLSTYADIYVNDAFGAAHRKHASVHAIHKFFPKKAYAGFLMKKEIEALDKILNKPQKPFAAIVGGAKVSDKIKTIEKLLISVDHLLIGGAMAYPFLKSQSHQVGKSLCSNEDVELAKNLLKNDKGKKIVLPLDHVISESLDGKAQLSESIEIADGFMGLDIGPKSIEKYSQILQVSKTILWNGPMGLFEKEQFAEGTMKLAQVIANTTAFSLVGGGDSVSAVKKSGTAEKFSHVSTGGGASLEYIEKGQLPGVQALKFGVDL